MITFKEYWNNLSNKNQNLKLFEKDTIIKMSLESFKSQLEAAFNEGRNIFENKPPKFEDVEIGQGIDHLFKGFDNIFKGFEGIFNLSPSNVSTQESVNQTTKKAQEVINKATKQINEVSEYLNNKEFRDKIEQKMKKEKEDKEKSGSFFYFWRKNNDHNNK